jgi:hypothetical protein
LSSTSMPESVVTPHFPLAELLWPARADGVLSVLRIVILMALGTALLTLSAKVNLPLPYVPMTLQTLVVLMIGAAYGWRLGAATVIAYLAEGAIGWPVRRSGRRPRAAGGTDRGLFGRLCPSRRRHGMVERARLGSFGAAAFCGDGAWAHHHSGSRIYLAGVRHEARRREGLACRDRAVCRRIRDQECAWSHAGTGDQAVARSSRVRLLRVKKQRH